MGLEMQQEQCEIIKFREKYPILKVLSDEKVLMLQSTPVKLISECGEMIQSDKNYFRVREGCDNYYDVDFSYEEFLMLIEEMRTFAEEYREKTSPEYYRQ